MHARSQAALRVHDGQRGYLAVATSEEERKSPKSQFPGTHHSFWLGGHGVVPHGDTREYSCSWENGDEWDYTARPAARCPSARLVGPPLAGRRANVEVQPGQPRLACGRVAYGWSGRGISSDEFGYIVEFDPVAVATATSR